MENDIKMRVQRAMKELEISVNALSNFRQLTRSTVNDQINGASKIGASTLEALLEYRPDLSAEWLLRGVGDMLTITPDVQLYINPALNQKSDYGFATGVRATVFF